MTHLITRACCNDAACVAVCPVNCIHPTPDEPAYRTAELLFIDPGTCIDCGACVEVCPVDAIKRDTELTTEDHGFLALNARFFDDFDYPRPGFVESAAERARGTLTETLRLAVVGSGPAAVYAVEAAIQATDGNVDVHVFERLSTPWGLVRFGVAPDHQDTKNIVHGMERILSAPQVTLHLNVEIGTHLHHDELRKHFHAIIYATGAPDDRRLAIGGEELPGSISAADFVAWYNGHPDAAHHRFDLSGPRAVIFGNGNVALDAARILVSDPETLGARSDIAAHALAELNSSGIREVVVIGRRGPEQAAFTTPELLALSNTPGIDVVVAPYGIDVVVAPYGIDGVAEQSYSAKAQLIARLPRRGESGDSRRVILRFLASPLRILGETKVTGVELMRNELTAGGDGRLVASPSGESETLDCGLVLRAVGYRGRDIAGVPFDEKRGAFREADGRLLDGTGNVVTGAYTAGWAKRGPSGVIGTNRSCAGETVASVVDDFARGLLGNPEQDPDEIGELLRRRHPETLDMVAWRRIDTYEQDQGRAARRPRIKLVDAGELLAVGRGTR